MRVSGSGGGYENSGGRNNRSDSFRHKHHLGQKVKGTILKYISDDMAWISIDGNKLLAQLKSTHQVGSRLTFLIKQLVPDIVLKEIFEFDSDKADVLGLASSFDTARTLFENRFRKRLSNRPSTPYLFSPETFLEDLISDISLYAAFKDAVDCASSISNHLEIKNKGCILYQPWLMPHGRRQTTFIRDLPQHEEEELIEVICEFEHFRWGMVRSEFLYKKPKLGYKLKIQNTCKDKSLLKYLANRTYPALNTKIQCLGLTKFSQNIHGSILTKMLFGT